MQDITPYLGAVYDFINGGFSTINAQLLGLAVAGIAAIMLKDWKGFWPMLAASTVVYLLVAHLILPVLGGARFALPANLLTLEFVISAAQAAVGLLVVTSIFFFIKKNVLKAG